MIAISRLSTGSVTHAFATVTHAFATEIGDPIFQIDPLYSAYGSARFRF